ncbi:MAG: hypothetical protein K9K68_06315, partial [Methylococcaceae bacterium]|nr:hypothetical protein [Methylococcaceae bacterium]
MSRSKIHMAEPAPADFRFINRLIECPTYAPRRKPMGLHFYHGSPQPITELLCPFPGFFSSP